MNVQTQPQRTAAESALVQAFADRVSELPGSAAVTVRRDAAVETLKAGLPTRKVEAWHYTDLRRLLASVPEFAAENAAEAVTPLLDGAAVLPLLGGVAGEAAAMPEGASVEPLAPRLTDGSFDALLTAERGDTVGTINSAFVSDGFVVRIAEGAALAAPLELQNVHAGGQAHGRFVVEAGAGARATVIERQTGGGEALVSSVSHLELGEGADVTWLVVQEQPEDATHLAQFRATLARDARLTLFVMNAGGRLVRQEVLVTAAGEGSEFRLRGVNLLAGETHCDVTMVLDHDAPSTVSTETLRNVVTGRARGVFQGQIRVDREAQKTDAKMACNTLLLSDDGEFSAKPELEIFADDVACGHGATVTEIDRNHLFYLMARGIDEKTARGLLVKAFLAEVIEELDDEPVVEALEAKLDAWFATHG
ncbi:Fe-S cluster assembly protein SufD [Aquibium sp. A9E412]|uniref:Fe-S cluster assembly protein SufD n=1 Tax=Aquibium sp. A9E412 TaxID=2976767 RepID=UPI0025AF48BB|nr:Fe-S cluster assembly protein SufD [Aquibium sp. A9E412]MDN2567365.1 Fe-S cluster assembly protein SufD [Aquibium sp. A9E412]